MVHFGDVALTVEIADEPKERSQGLMHRTSLAPDSGMLFVYPAEEARNFWMKDTPLALSIAYVDQAGRIVHLADMTPLSTDPVPSEKPAMYAIEVPQGWFAAHDIHEGSVVTGLPGASAR